MMGEGGAKSLAHRETVKLHCPSPARFTFMRAPVGHGSTTRGGGEVLFSFCLLLFIFQLAAVFDLHPLGDERRNCFSFSESCISFPADINLPGHKVGSYFCPVYPPLDHRNHNRPDHHIRYDAESKSKIENSATALGSTTRICVMMGLLMQLLKVLRACRCGCVSARAARGSTRAVTDQDAVQGPPQHVCWAEEASPVPLCDFGARRRPIGDKLQRMATGSIIMQMGGLIMHLLFSPRRLLRNLGSNNNIG